MAHVVRMPSVVANATEAIVAQWLVSVGAHVSLGDPIAEIETEKALVEYAAEVEGTVGRLLAEPGATVAVGTPIAVVLEEGEDAASVTFDEPDPTPSRPEPAPAPQTAASATLTTTELAAPVTPPGANGTQPGGRLFTTPLVRRLATERGIDLTLVRGTGPHGRIVRRDLDAYTPTVESAPPPPASGQVAPAATGHTDVPLSGMRRAIARRLTESKTTVPHFYVTAHARVDQLLALRQEANVLASRKISVNDIVVKAVGAALVEVPAANAVWNGDAIRRFDGVDVAVAVAVPDGLLTPVVRGVHTLTVTELSARLADLAERARAGRLQQHELEGGSFSVSNLGMYGVDEFSAILNPPQAGILAVAAAKRQPVVGEDGELGVGSVMTVTLSADHRVIDGAVAAEWMAALVRRLENPLSILL
ncbi:2-oxo acid dehydrogenase subunit E2 [Streptomyces griseorubiginosus]|uniref:2-oxo acid dehydrogenase subunit E2 n=1 Tax=Streptomyces griseorubiginosus TaxID=67304 RepID=UPI001AD79CDF|nr:2-oxo acid dehydrogenase subunit E2 [Streptomyces griseorubiginosus]MBO4253155.1 pyruvate dehydrogenase complex dihydrolipoamide acetyltransferase [Streptomyces griseorubiginosus]